MLAGLHIRRGQRGISRARGLATALQGVRAGYESGQVFDATHDCEGQEWICLCTTRFLHSIYVKGIICNCILVIIHIYVFVYSQNV